MCAMMCVLSSLRAFVIRDKSLSTPQAAATTFLRAAHCSQRHVPQARVFLSGGWCSRCRRLPALTESPCPCPCLFFRCSSLLRTHSGATQVTQWEFSPTTPTKVPTHPPWCPPQSPCPTLYFAGSPFQWRVVFGPARESWHLLEETAVASTSANEV